MNDSQREEMMESRKQNEDSIQRGEAMERLVKNKDFQKLFIEEFIEKGAVNMIRLINHESVKDKFILKQYKSKLTAIGVLRNYIDAITVEGNYALNQNIEIDNILLNKED